jgi:nucleoside-diphosphate-sugar epimerase
MNDMPQMRVTGAAGFIGRRVVARLAGLGARVSGVDRVLKPADWPPGAEYVPWDLGKGLPAVAAGFVLVHLAWNMDRADPEAQSGSTADFVRLLGTPGLQGVVGMGSAEEYGRLSGCLAEGRAPGPGLSAYGKAKNEACRALETWTRAPGRRAFWLRPFIVYGPGQGGRMAIPYALQCAKERKPAEFSEGLQRRDFVHVDDVADGIVQAALRLQDTVDPFSVCNLGCGEPIQLRNVLDRIAQNTQAQEFFHFGARPMRAGEPMEQYADVSAAKTLLGWSARISWKAGMDALCPEAKP